MSDAVQIAVVGHTNAGKTSLLRTLTRRGSFGDVSDTPGTTRHVEAIELAFDGVCAAKFFDTPGFEDSVALLDYINALDGCSTRPDRVQALLRGPEAGRTFEQEAKVLRTMLDIDAAFYVIDCREHVLPKFRAEIDILMSCAKPLLPVLNFVGHPASRDDEWQRAFAEHGLHALARFDAVAPFTGSEENLYRDLIPLLRGRESQINDIIDCLAFERHQRRDIAVKVIASMLVDVTAMRSSISKVELAEPVKKKRFIRNFRTAVTARARTGIDDVLEIYAFRRDEADLTVVPWLDGRWEADLFNPEVLRAASLELGAGVAIGGSLGFAVDVALAGLSLGAGTAVGAAVGGAVSQGFGRLTRRVVNKLRGRVDLSLENEVIQVLAANALALLAALELRGHAALGKVPVGLERISATLPKLGQVLKALEPARGRPEWLLDGAKVKGTNRRREQLVDAVAAELDKTITDAI